jgi:hypothetical protein
MRVGRQRQAVIRARRAIRVEAEILGAAHRGLRHVADRLPGIDRLDQRDLVGARLDGVGDPVQQRAPFVAGGARPAGAEGFRRGPRGPVDLGSAAARDLRDRHVVDRRLRLEGASVARVGLAVD